MLIGTMDRSGASIEISSADLISLQCFPSYARPFKKGEHFVRSLFLGFAIQPIKSEPICGPSLIKSSHSNNVFLHGRIETKNAGGLSHPEFSPME